TVGTTASADAAPGHRVCDERGTCAVAKAPKSKKVKREARRWDRGVRADYIYQGRVSRPLKSGHLTIVRKSRARAKTWHVWQARRVTITPPRPRPTPRPEPTCAEQLDALPMGQHLALSYVYPGLIDCDASGRMVVTAP